MIERNVTKTQSSCNPVSAHWEAPKTVLGGFEKKKKKRTPVNKLP